MKPRFSEAELCPDCSSPYVVVNQLGLLVRYYHDETCPILQQAAAENRRRAGVAEAVTSADFTRMEL